MIDGPAELMSIVIMVLGIVSILGSILLYTRRKVPEGSLTRITLLIVGICLVQVGTLAGDQMDTKGFVRIGLLAALLVLLAGAAFRDGWRSGPTETNR